MACSTSWLNPSGCTDEADQCLGLCDGMTTTEVHALGEPDVSCDGMFILTTGLVAASDGGGGSWIWGASVDKSTANLGTIIDPSIGLTASLQGTGVGSGCWLREYSGAVYAEWYGAKGDGATDDTAALTAAFSSGYDVSLSLKTYMITDLIMSSVSNVAIYGNGATIKHISDTDAFVPGDPQSWCLDLDSCTNVTIKDLRMVGNHYSGTTIPTAIANNYQGGLIARGSDNIRVVGCRIENCYACFWSRVNSSNVTFSNCVADTCRYGFAAIDTTEFIVESCTSYDAHFDPANSDGGGYGFLIDNAPSSIVRDCVAHRSGSDCFRANPDAEDSVFDNCVSYDSRRYGSSIRAVERVMVRNCVFDRVGNTSIWDGTNNHTAHHSSFYGILLNPESHSCSVIGCYVYMSTTASKSGAGISLAVGAETKGIVFSNNKVIAESYVDNLILVSPSRYAQVTNNYAENLVDPVDDVTAAKGRSFVFNDAYNGIFSNNTAINSRAIISYIYDGVISGNTIIGSSQAGIKHYGTGSVLIGNVIDGAGADAVGSHANMHILGDDNTLNGNIYSNGTYVSLWIGAGLTGTVMGNDMSLDLGKRADSTVATHGVPFYTKSAALSDSVAADVATLKTDFNTLLANLRAAGVQDS